MEQLSFAPLGEANSKAFNLRESPHELARPSATEGALIQQTLENFRRGSMAGDLPPFFFTPYFFGNKSALRIMICPELID